MDFYLLQQIVVSLGLGLLVGLERERTESSIAGIRTFPLISVFGTICAYLALSLGGWVLAAGLVCLSGVLIFANLAKIKNGEVDPGMTTEIAALLLFGVGALVAIDKPTEAVVLGGIMVVLLHLKTPLHNFAAAVGERDMHAMMQFVVLSLVILPVLPNENYGPFGVWNPFKIWLMVVLIVGISLGGYVAYKLFGAKAGTLLGGVIGGIVSSTATTVSFAKRTSSNADLSTLGALVIMIASCLSFVRVIVEIGVVAPGYFLQIAPPLIGMLILCSLISGGLFFLASQKKVSMPEQKNPAELKSAIIFGALYALVLLGVAAGEKYFGDAGLYVVGIISGLTDMDAITLSTAQLAAAGGVSTRTAWSVILVASMANFIFKFGIVAALGPRQLAWRVGAAFGMAMAGGGLILLLWPAGVPIES